MDAIKTPLNFPHTIHFHIRKRRGGNALRTAVQRNQLAPSSVHSNKSQGGFAESKTECHVLWQYKLVCVGVDWNHSHYSLFAFTSVYPTYKSLCLILFNDSISPSDSNVQRLLPVKIMFNYFCTPTGAPYTQGRDQSGGHTAPLKSDRPPLVVQVLGFVQSLKLKPINIQFLISELFKLIYFIPNVPPFSFCAPLWPQN